MTFSSAQLRQLAGIFTDIGQVVLASIIIPAFVGSPSLHQAILGFAVAGTAWAMSLWLVRLAADA